MLRFSALAALLMMSVAVSHVGAQDQAAIVGPGAITAIRLNQNPLITVHTSSSLGNDVNGPAVVRAPAWIRRPLGRYYMYFAHHKGQFIRLAYADAIGGPWRVYEPGVLNVRDTALFRPQPDPPDSPRFFYTHVASPEIAIDTARQKVVLWFHGWWTEGQRWPSGVSEAQKWATDRGYEQFTQVAESTDGLHFQVLPAISKESYLRVFPFGGHIYAMARLGRLLRTDDPLASFELGPNPFRDGPYANRVRHVATLVRGNTLRVFFTGIGDAPERIMASTIDLRGDWNNWRASEPVELLRPDTPYECAALPDAPSEAGAIEVPVRQLRDPAVFEENGHTFLFYSICGEQGIAAAELISR